MTRGVATTLQSTNDPDRWPAAYRASGQPVSPFHCYAWFEFAAAITGHRFTPLVAQAGGDDLGVAPELTRRRGPVTTLNWLPFPCVGPLVAPEHLASTLGRLRHRALRTSLPPGLEVRQDFTWLIDTSQSEADLLACAGQDEP